MFICVYTYIYIYIYIYIYYTERREIATSCKKAAADQRQQASCNDTSYKADTVSFQNFMFVFSA